MKAEKIDRITVVGSGVMGSSIAQAFAMGGIDVVMVDVDEKFLVRAMGLIESGLKTIAEAEMFPDEWVSLALSRVTTSVDFAESAKDTAFVVEVVPEVPDVKKKVFSQLSDICTPETVIASNTSALDIFSIADIPHPERLIITHFFSPASIIPLVEIVPGPRTSPETISLTVDFMKRAGKSPVVMKRFGPGFIVNRIQRAIGETVLDMIEEGLAGPAEIDRAVKLSLGIRLPVVGVIQTFDFQGLDMLLQYQRNVGKVYSLIEEKVNQGRLGAKTSEGIYDYGGRSEVEIVKKRDELFLKMLDYLQEIRAFEPV